MDWRHASELLEAGRSIYSECKNLCVWVNTNAGMGSLYRSQHELVFVFKVGTASNAVLLPSTRSFRWVQGEDLAQEWERLSGRGKTFCRVCGSPLPGLHRSGKVFWVPAGILDDDPGTRIEQHIFVGSKAPWDEIPGGAPQYEEEAPARR
jgi:hypothetical protein